MKPLPLVLVTAISAIALSTVAPAHAHCLTVQPDPLTGEKGKVHRWVWLDPYSPIARSTLLPGPVSSTVTSFGGQVQWTYDLTEVGWMDRTIRKNTPIILTLNDGRSVELPILQDTPARLMNRDSSTLTLWRVTLDIPIDLARTLASTPPAGLRVQLAHAVLHGVFRPAPARRISAAFACVLDR